MTSTERERDARAKAHDLLAESRAIEICDVLPGRHSLACDRVTTAITALTTDRDTWRARAEKAEADQRKRDGEYENYIDEQTASTRTLRVRLDEAVRLLARYAVVKVGPEDERPRDTCCAHCYKAEGHFDGCEIGAFLASAAAGTEKPGAGT